MWCARIDFRRGTAADDLRNIKWSEMLAQLPGYAAVLTKQQNPSSLTSMGNAMEMAVGLAYACHTNFVHLPEDHRIEFRNGMQEKGTLLWGISWPLFQQLGLSATERMYTPVADRSATEHPAGQGAATSSSFDSSGGVAEHIQQREASLEYEAAAGPPHIGTIDDNDLPFFSRSQSFDGLQRKHTEPSRKHNCVRKRACCWIDWRIPMLRCLLTLQMNGLGGSHGWQFRMYRRLLSMLISLASLLTSSKTHAMRIAEVVSAWPSAHILLMAPIGASIRASDRVKMRNPVTFQAYYGMRRASAVLQSTRISNG